MKQKRHRIICGAKCYHQFFRRLSSIANIGLNLYGLQVVSCSSPIYKVFLWGRWKMQGHGYVENQQSIIRCHNPKKQKCILRFKTCNKLERPISYSRLRHDDINFKKSFQNFEGNFYYYVCSGRFLRSVRTHLNMGKLSHESRLISKVRLLAIRNSNLTQNFFLYKIYAFDFIINPTVDMYSIGLFLLIYSINPEAFLIDFGFPNKVFQSEVQQQHCRRGYQFQDRSEGSRISKHICQSLRVLLQTSYK